MIVLMKIINETIFNRRSRDTRDVIKIFNVNCGKNTKRKSLSLHVKLSTMSVKRFLEDGLKD